MERDLRDTPLYQEVEAYFTAIYAPGAHWVSDGSTVTVSPDGRQAAFTGTVFHDLQSAPVTRVCLVDLASGAMQQVAAAAYSDRLPRWSPDGSKLAFLSDRAGAGNFQLYWLQPDGRGAAHALRCSTARWNTSTGRRQAFHPARPRGVRCRSGRHRRRWQDRRQAGRSAHLAAGD